MPNLKELEDELYALQNKSLLQPLSALELQTLRAREIAYQALIASQVDKQKAVKEAKSKEMRNRRRRGKYGEKKLAKEVGGRKDGGIGRKDVVAGMFSYELKTLQKIPSSIVNIMNQAERLKKRGTIAIGVFRCNSPRHEYFIIGKEDWLELHGKG